MRALAVATVLLVAGACQSPKPEGEAGASASVEPSAAPRNLRASASDQRRLRLDASAQVLPSGGETDGREIDAGVGFRAEAKKGCSDTKCTGDNCARLCAKWTAENPPSAATGDVRSKVYLSCLGTCLTETDQ